MMAARRLSGAYWIFALFFSLISLLFILLILLSGVGGHVVAEYLTIDTADLDVPAKLGSSELLKDLSTIAGQDWVGSDANAKSLGLAQTYSLNLLTACAEDDGSTTCGAPKIGFSFDPSSDFHLDSTSIQGTFSSAYSDQLQTYSKVSTFLGVGYVLGALFTGLSCLFIIMSRCFPRAILVSQFASALAFLFLLASAIASVVMFVKLKNTFNDALGPSGIQSQASAKMFGLGFGAAGLAFSSFMLMLPLSRGRDSQRHQVGLDSKSGTLGMVTGAQGAGPTPGLLNRVTTWGRHKYMQVEKQRPVLHARSVSRDSDREGLIATVEDDFSHEYPNDFAMGPMQKKYNGPSRDPSATYDPHVNTSYESQVAPAYDSHKS
ncbi:hypothetical protein F4677DRAFT_5193 [Hypoxylon crocopeplum]|nr:hypothetical protein F4677DRAFT_5193 [Hypoxylon crocopeplum]